MSIEKKVLSLFDEADGSVVEDEVDAAVEGVGGKLWGRGFERGPSRRSAEANLDLEAGQGEEKEEEEEARPQQVVADEEAGRRGGLGKVGWRVEWHLHEAAIAQSKICAK